MSPLVSVTTIKKQYVTEPLFDALSFAVNERERVGVIGRNGSGKSTLLRILCGLEEVDDGIVSTRKGARIVYVAQQDQVDPATTVEQYLSEVRDIDPSRCAALLGRARLPDGDTCVAALSGGQRKRLAIIRGLASDPDLLLLDEPTNHLDAAGIRWLEEQVAGLRCACVFVSHDRHFIEAVAERVIELDRSYPGGFLSVAGGYADFLEKRELFREQVSQQRASMANKVRREVEWLRRSAKAQTKKQKARSDAAEGLIGELAELSKAEEVLRLEFAASERKTKVLIKAELISQAFGERVVFKDCSLVVSPGKRIGIVGLNGSGKTTLLRTLLKDLPVRSGKLVHANNLSIALLDQFRSAINPTLSLRRFLSPEGEGVVFNDQQYHVRAWAKRFLFAPEQLEAPLGALSGGEQARALIARIILEKADILVLDEPTNDLDIPTLEVLEDALCEFPGGVLVVSHDRYFLDRVCTSVVGLYGAGLVGTFADHAQWERVALEAQQNAERSSSIQRTGALAPKRQARKLGYLEERELRGMEAAVEAADTALRALQAELNDPALASDAARLAELCEAVAQAEAKLEQLFARWQELESKASALGEG